MHPTLPPCLPQNLDRALLIEMWTASAYGDYRRTQGG